MWHKADWMGHQIRLELTFASLLLKLANHYTTRSGSLMRYICPKIILIMEHHLQAFCVHCLTMAFPISFHDKFAHLKHVLPVKSTISSFHLLSGHSIICLLFLGHYFINPYVIFPSRRRNNRSVATFVLTTSRTQTTVRIIPGRLTFLQ